MNIYQYGDTIRFECLFNDFDGQKVDPETIKIVIYNQKYKPLTTIIFGSPEQERDIIQRSLGEYYFDYTTQEKEQKLYYEWSGVIGGTTSLHRGSFMTKFI